MQEPALVGAVLILLMQPDRGGQLQAEEAAQPTLPLEGTVLITVADRDKSEVLAVARRFAELGFRILATAGTRAFLASKGIDSTPVQKVHEGRPNIEDAVKKHLEEKK